LSIVHDRKEGSISDFAGLLKKNEREVSGFPLPSTSVDNIFVGDHSEHFPWRCRSLFLDKEVEVYPDTDT
jgi:hypothetical protein